MTPSDPATRCDPTGPRAPSSTGPPKLLQLRPDLLLSPTRALLRAVPGDLRRTGRQSLTLLVGSALASPPRPLLRLLRRVRPRLTIRGLTLLTDSTAVLNAVTDSASNRVTPYGRAMSELIGPFALGLDGPEHAGSRARLVQVLAAIDTDELGLWADRAAQLLLQQSRADGRLEVVGELAAPLTAAFVHRYLRVEPGPGGERDDPGTLVGILNQPTDLAELTGAVFEACFLNLAQPNDRVVAERGRAAAVTLAARCPMHRPEQGEPASSPTTDESADHEVVDLIGLAVGAVPTVIEAIVRVIGVLLDKHEALTAARQAGQDRAQLWQVILEALRFDPQSPGLARENVTTGLVLASTYAAMHDPVRVPRPGEFRTDRPADAYLHFGAGPHRCLGEPFARELLVSAVAAVVAEPHLAPIDGPAGRLVTDGPMPRRYFVSLQG